MRSAAVILTPASEIAQVGDSPVRTRAAAAHRCNRGATHGGKRATQCREAARAVSRHNSGKARAVRAPPPSRRAHSARLPAARRSLEAMLRIPGRDVARRASSLGHSSSGRSLQLLCNRSFAVLQIALPSELRWQRSCISNSMQLELKLSIAAPTHAHASRRRTAPWKNVRCASSTTGRTSSRTTAR